VGKTSLLRILVGEESQDAGTLRIGSGVQIGYSEQEQSRIRGATSVLDEVWSVTPEVTEGEVRGFLGSFLFRNDDVFKPLNSLSGGERSRVALAKLVRQGANLLILDEPTNHLDIESREVIEAALCAYTGTLLVVSHDRYFLDRVVDHVMELEFEGCRVYEGGYTAYAAARAAAAVRAAAQVAKPGKEGSAPRKANSKADRKEDPGKSGRGGADYEAQKQRKRAEERLVKRVKKAEQEIARMEARKEKLLMEMADPEVATDAEKVAALNGDLKKTEAGVREAITRWEEVAMRLEAYRDGK
jgi:ATP-binding cassette subfamily F protein 3